VDPTDEEKKSSDIKRQIRQLNAAIKAMQRERHFKQLKK
jgi:hypothetical protein